MVLRSYEPVENGWDKTDETCRNCGEPVYTHKVAGLQPDGVMEFGTAYKCLACDYTSPSQRAIDDFRGSGSNL